VFRKVHAAAKENPLKSKANLVSDLPHSKPVWIGLCGEEDRNIYGLRELQGKYRLRLFEWDGRCVPSSFRGPLPNPIH
jgi:hypothetical protein